MVVCCQVAVQPCNVRVSGESNEVLCEYLMNYKLDYTQKPQVLDNKIQNYLKNIIAHPTRTARTAVELLLSFPTFAM